jgi:hypothetical protein
MTEDLFKLVSTAADGITEEFVTLVEPDTIREQGLRPEQIVGKLRTATADGGKVDADNFMPNVAFVDYLHEFVARTAAEDKGLIAAAESGKVENLFVVDQRAVTPAAEVPPEDILGAFVVKDGAISAADYQSNRGKHRLLTSRGFFNLGAGAMQKLVDAQTALSDLPVVRDDRG